MEKHALYHMTWKEIEEVFKNDPVVIIPMGSTEQQGIHSLTGDYLAAEAIAKRVAEKPVLITFLLFRLAAVNISAVSRAQYRSALPR